MSFDPTVLLALALDLDGTLLDESGKLTAYTLKTLHQVSQRGLKLVVASGRMAARTTPFAGEIGIPMSVIAFNGAETLSGQGQTWTSQELRAISPPTKDAIFRLCRDGAHFLNIYTQGKLFGYHPEGKFAASAIYSQQTGAEYAGLLENLESIPAGEIPKLLVVETPENRDKLFQAWSSKLGGHCSLVKSNPEYLEILDLGVNKGSALKAWLKTQGLGPENLIAFGDAENDLEMLNMASVGIAMGNSTAGLRTRYSHFSTWTNTQNGVARELSRIFQLGDS